MAIIPYNCAHWSPELIIRFAVIRSCRKTHVIYSWCNNLGIAGWFSGAKCYCPSESYSECVAQGTRSTTQQIFNRMMIQALVEEQR